MDIPDQNLEQLKGWKRFTNRAKGTIIRSHEIAKKYRNEFVTPIHVFRALIDEPSVLILRIFNQISLDLETTKAQITQEIERRTKSGVTEPTFSEELKELINRSFLMAEKLSHVYVGSEHLLLSMLDSDDEEFVKELKQLGMTSGKVSEIATSLGTYPPGILSQPAGDPTSQFDFEERASSLPFFSRDMNELAKEGNFLKITGRDHEIERLVHILSRKTKNNPILVGDAGVGKTAIVQGLAQRIVAGDVPPSFINKTILSLDVSSIIAGAKVRGDVEERILSLVNDAIEDGDKIIFIDEIHMIVGAGSAGQRDPMDMSNILKPYLTDNNLRIIGATTVDEYRKYFDEDPALSRRFQPIEVDEISKESALDILNHLKKDFEVYHGVKIKPEAIKDAVELSAKFITERYLPDKAIDLIDEAGASVKIGREIYIEPTLTNLGKKLVKVQEKKEKALDAGDMGRASKLRAQEEEITAEIELLVEGKHQKSAKKKVVDSELIKKIVVDWTKIPLAAGSVEEEKLANLYKSIKERIVGEDHVLADVVDAIKRSHLGLVSTSRPLASFLFLGPTGVGKTELAKTIAQEVFGSEDLLVQLNMSEYMEMHSVAKMIGSPPGYVGYTEGGQLTEAIRRRPYSVVLFDEIEKAHPEALNLLLQILEEGELKDGRGKKADFRNTIVILTSNIGAEEVSKDNKLGFDIEIESIANEELDQAFEDMKESLLESLKFEIRPELLNRLDAISVFRGLNEEDCLVISNNMLNRLTMNLLESGIVLEVSKGVAKLVNKEGYSPEYGARNIRRKIQELVENGLANYLISNKVKKPKNGLLKIKVKVKGDELIFSKS